MISIRPLIPASMSRQGFEEQVRERLTQTVEAAKADIEDRIAELRRTQHEGELQDVIGALEGQLSGLQATLSNIATASLASLMILSNGMHTRIGATQHIAMNSSVRGSFEAAHFEVEMTVDKLMSMSAKEIGQLQAYHDAEAAAFRSYENRTARTIETRAAAQGIDIGGYQENRERILRERAEAEREGNRTEAFKQNALLARNNLFGLVKTNASEEDISTAAEKDARMREAYLQQVQIEAVNAGREQGLSGDALKSHIIQSRQKAANELDEENIRNAQTAGLSPEQQHKVVAATTTYKANEKTERNEFTDVDRSDAAFSGKHATEDEYLQARGERGKAKAELGGLHFGAGLNLAGPASEPLQVAQTQARDAVKNMSAITPANSVEERPEVEAPTVPHKVAAKKHQGASPAA